MPIYEYEAIDPRRSCTDCRSPFEALQGAGEEPLSACPSCGNRVRKIISRCHAAVVEASAEHTRVEGRIKDYERAGMWSHAA
ncbi:MAG: zinc ribbon domain-containing protein, partial [Deltaproteobacteria bacterium]|nr:zinc ribbon domain-containing protein [Deltaproteobacteria bacterium]